MPRDQRSFLYVGIKGCVVALDCQTGDEVWRTDLRSAEFVSVLWDGAALFAANSGEVWRIDPATGATIWHNKMKGLGRGLVALASSTAAGGGGNTELAEQTRRQAAAGAAAAT
jgi:outer membrane protein assembly factor BamB